MYLPPLPRQSLHPVKQYIPRLRCGLQYYTRTPIYARLYRPVLSLTYLRRM